MDYLEDFVAVLLGITVTVAFYLVVLLYKGKREMLRLALENRISSNIRMLYLEQDQSLDVRLRYAKTLLFEYSAILWKEPVKENKDIQSETRQKLKDLDTFVTCLCLAQKKLKIIFDSKTNGLIVFELSNLISNIDNNKQSNDPKIIEMINDAKKLLSFLDKAVKSKNFLIHTKEISELVYLNIDFEYYKKIYKK